MISQEFHNWLVPVWENLALGEGLLARREFLQRAHRFGLPLEDSFDRLFRLLVDDGIAPIDAIDFLLLHLSFLRNEGRHDEAARGLAQLDRCRVDLGLLPSFRLLFQQGLQALQAKEYARAMKAFSFAAKESRTPFDSCLAVLHRIICLESLGFDSAEQIGELKRRLTLFPGEPWTEQILDRLEALEIRQALRVGDTEWLRAKVLGPRVKGALSAYHQGWVALLPYFDWSERPSVRANQIEDEYFLRTLSFLLLPEELASKRSLCDGIARCYLWIWTWLVDAEPPLLEKSLRVVRALLSNAPDSLTSQEFTMLENGLRWLGLFAGLDTNRVRAMLSGLSGTKSIVSPLLTYEALLLDFLFSRREGNEPRVKIAAEALLLHPGHLKAHFLLPQLVESLLHEGVRTPDSLVPLKESVESLMPPSGPKDGALVHLDGKRIDLFEGGQLRSSLFSPALCRLLHRFRWEMTVPVRDLAAVCFGFKRYDPFIHDPKIAKLLSRANRLFHPHLKFCRREDRIHAIGNTGHLFWRATGIHSEMFLASPEAFRWFEEGVSGAEKSATPLIIRAQSGLQDMWVKRREIEGLLNCSRSSAIRQLRRWLREGKAESRGIGKASRYRLSAKAVTDLRRT